MKNIFKALGNRKRREILKTVLNKEMHISAIAREIKVSVPVALRHINILEEAGLVSRKKVGRSHIITANLEDIRKLRNIWDLEESFIVKVEKGVTVQEALSSIPGIGIRESEKGSYIFEVESRQGYYIYEIGGRLIDAPINEHMIEEDCEIEIKRLLPAMGKKIKIITT